MGHITIADELVTKLRTVKERIEVRDEVGQVLGHYIPVTGENHHATAVHLFDLEEAARIATTEKGGSPLAEVWQRIKGGEKSE